MSNEMISLKDLNSQLAEIPSSVDSSALSLVKGGGSFHPYITVGGASSKAVKDRKLGIGELGLVQGQDISSLGEEVPCVVLAVGFLAMDFRGEKPVRLTNPEDPLWPELKALADQKGMMGAQYGPEFFMWLPDQQTYATLFCGSVSARNEAATLVDYFQKGGHPTTQTLRVRAIDNATYGTYYIPGFKASSLDYPLPGSVIEELKKFKNPPKKEVVDEADSSDR